MLVSVLRADVTEHPATVPSSGFELSTLLSLLRVLFPHRQAQEPAGPCCKGSERMQRLTEPLGSP